MINQMSREALIANVPSYLSRKELEEKSIEELRDLANDLIEDIKAERYEDSEYL